MCTCLIKRMVPFSLFEIALKSRPNRTEIVAGLHGYPHAIATLASANIILEIMTKIAPNIARVCIKCDFINTIINQYHSYIL